MGSILDKIVAHKLDEIAHSKSLRSLKSVSEAASESSPPHDFLNALTSTDFVGLIAEVKKASPSKGIIREDFDPVGIAKIYCRSGAHCISVLTDEHFFQGSLEYLSAIRTAVSVPLLRKDFIIDEYQVYEARAAGADAVLLIAECLETNQMKDLHETISGLGMTPLVELYEEDNVDRVLDCNPRLVGINNRDLKTFEVDLGRSVRLRHRIPDEIAMVSESGITSNADVKMLHQAGIDAMLVGESLMRADDIAEAVESLLADAKS